MLTQSIRHMYLMTLDHSVQLLLDDNDADHLQTKVPRSLPSGTKGREMRGCIDYIVLVHSLKNQPENNNIIIIELTINYASNENMY